ncbi:hypothetical protein EDEG_03936 [Edhazardia aedis USNM 41457]|uniref:CDP-alcohol phosphatidyltransferase n=1 Tax=Edhazardia aedis (strain USNM 41457) TaxID=1003232 RepID=J9DFV1_EDHAE|nr:hypothetical protein EDEG_03936 [Edhazardia aedis USNM 41457]|eukprot:EJW01480.1 hypothetical protein EDEG_03936 [Edhazardia aedis USNM 41457]
MGNPQQLENLRKYEYHSTDRSIVYNSILKHYHNFLINLVSKKIHPNVLTFIGLCFMILSTVLTISVDPYLTRGYFPHAETEGIMQYEFFKKIYHYLPLINGILLFLYQTFDALDGKQARRLKLSTPLGQLFDHGCDAVTCFLTAVCLCSSMGISIQYLYLIVLNFISIYYFCNIEEYFTNKFYLGFINGPTEGILAAVITHFLCFFKNNLFNKDGFLYCMPMKKVKLGPFTYNVLQIETVVFVILSLLATLFSILRNRHKGTKSELFMSICNMYCLTFSCFLFFYTTKDLLLKYVAYFEFMFIFNRLNIDIAYSHLKKCSLKECRLDFSFYSYIFFAPIGIVMPLTGFFHMVMFTVAFVAYFEKIKETISEICNFLEINCFTIGEKMKKE